MVKFMQNRRKASSLGFVSSHTFNRVARMSPARASRWAWGRASAKKGHVGIN